MCHSAVDPLAGLWRNFSGNGQYRVQALDANTENMPLSGFGETLLPDGDDPIRFAATHIVQHERNPLGRGVTPGDIVAALDYLLAASTVTGEVLTIDGGQKFAPPTRDVQFLEQ